MGKDTLEAITDLLRTITGRERKKHYTSAVILAGGTGERFGGDKPKQLCLLDGIPVAVRTLMTFEACPLINEIILVSRKDDIPEMKEYCDKYNITKLREIVSGGETRQESAMSGFEAIEPKSEFVLFHDAARCLVTEEIIKNTLYDAYDHGAATAAERAVDTVKYATKDNFIDSTIDRSYVWLVKTPQVFMANMYRAAAYMAKQDGISATDDCYLAERLGFKVKLTDCGNENLKITTKNDITAALAIIERRKLGDDGKDDGK